MEAAFVDIGKGRNAVLYAGEVNWEAAGMEGKPRKIEQALKSGDTVLVQVTKDPIGHKGARLTAQITLAGRHLVLVPSGAMTGISRKLPEKERQRLKKLLKEIVPAEHGVIVRTAAEGASEEQLRADVERLTQTWADIQEKSKAYKSAPTLLKGEPELAVRVVRDIFNEDFTSLKIQGDGAWKTLSEYVGKLSPELTERLEHWTRAEDIFTANRVDEQLAKAFDRKVWLPSGGTLIVDRTEAMTVIDVNTGKFTGAGGTLEETVTKNNLEAAEEIVRQLRLRDIGGIIVVDFIDMVLEANRELVLRRLIECLGRDRTRHQVAEVTSLGLVQMTRKRVGQGLVEAFSTTCEACDGAGYITHTHPVERADGPSDSGPRRNKKQQQQQQAAPEHSSESEAKRDGVKNALNSIAAAAAKGHDEGAGEPAGSGRDDSASEGSSKKGKKSKKGKSGGSKAGASKKGRRKDSGEGRSDSARNSQENAAGGSAPDSSVQSRAIVRKAAAPIEKPIERPAALRRAANAPVGKVEASSMAAGSAASAGEDSKDAKPKKARRVSSSGTITPGTGASAAIMTFPAQ
jgi:ribonuclease E